MSAARLRVGFIPLVDAAALLLAVDKGFAAQEGVEVDLAREASWSNIRDKLAIGHYDAAHLLAPMAIASTLGLQHVRAPLIAPYNLALNGNAITVSHALRAKLEYAAEGDLADPAVSARALAKVVRAGDVRGDEPLTFGMTFPFSTHNYQLRYWMGHGGIDPDEDLRLIVLPPPYMVESLARGQVDGFCVGAPWNTVAADAGVGKILHMGYEIFHPAPEKTLAVRAALAAQEPALVKALIRACLNAADFIARPENRDEVASILSRPDRVGVEQSIIRRVLDGKLRGAATTDGVATPNYLMIGERVCGRPAPFQAAWLYAQMLRWRQARFSREQLNIAEHIFDPALFDAAALPQQQAAAAQPIRSFEGPCFEPADIAGYLASFGVGARQGA